MELMQRLLGQKLGAENARLIQKKVVDGHATHLEPAHALVSQVMSLFAGGNGQQRGFSELLGSFAERDQAGILFAAKGFEILLGGFLQFDPIAATGDGCALIP